MEDLIEDKMEGKVEGKVEGKIPQPEFPGTRSGIQKKIPVMSPKFLVPRLMVEPPIRNPKSKIRNPIGIVLHGAGHRANSSPEANSGPVNNSPNSGSQGSSRWGNNPDSGNLAAAATLARQEHRARP